jgi:type IV secretory pathway VirB2 component (pilin)
VILAPTSPNIISGFISASYKSELKKYWTPHFQQAYSCRRSDRVVDDSVERERVTPMKVKRATSAATVRIAAIIFAFAGPAFAQAGGSPWENAVTVLRNSFTGPIATGLSLVAIVLGGLTYAYGEGHSKRTVAGIVFGVGMAIGAANFMSWMFPGA